MKKLPVCFFAVLLFACNNNCKESREEALNDKSISEDIEWSNTWMVSVNDDDLPRVLIIGDSHVERYYPLVAEQLKDKAYCSKFTTSRSLGDPALIEQFKTLFFSYKFDIISFNNGLHGVDYTDQQYSQYLPVVYRLFTESNHGFRLIWVNTTAIRIKDDISRFDERNKGIINRNKAVEKFTRKNGITLIDFYSLSASHPEFYESDGVHFNREGVETEARAISDGILKILSIGNQ